MERSADYIVAGAGSAGCILARRLAETGASVILLEAGGADRTRLVRQPGMIAIFHNVPALKKRLDWGYYTAPQENALGRRIPQPRGRVLGGSGSINGMVFVRGNRQNYDDWSCPGWSYVEIAGQEGPAQIHATREVILCAGVYGSPQLHVLPWSYPFPNQDSPERHKVDKRSALTIMPTLIYPKSRGTLRLADADPHTPPIIDPGYLTEPDDTGLLLDGMELVRAVMASKVIAGQVSLELSPGPAYPDRAALARELPNRATSVYHAVGTCRMGTDGQAVVDPSLKVRGIDGLRVADASIMPAIPGGNTNAPAMMIGEHAAHLMTAGS